MGLPKIVVHDRKVILLSGYRDDEADGAKAPVVIDAEDKLKQAVEKYPDAVAFGYVAGEWVAGA